jgi:ABC-2 type transport system ATP-binding protein
VAGALRDLLSAGQRHSEVTIVGASPALREALANIASATREVGDLLVMDVRGDEAVCDVVQRALADGARLESITPKRETLEDVFVRKAI